MASWTVLLDMRLHRQLKGWTTPDRIRLDALQRVLREGGPAALDWDAMTLANCGSWDEIEGSYRGDVWWALSPDPIRVTLEVLPRRTVCDPSARLGSASETQVTSGQRREVC